MVFISFTILDLGVYLLINYGFELIYSKFNIINLLLGTLGIILIIIFFIMLYKEICLTVKMTNRNIILKIRHKLN